jgi:hypothetical protein
MIIKILIKLILKIKFLLFYPPLNIPLGVRTENFAGSPSDLSSKYACLSQPLTRHASLFEHNTDRHIDNSIIVLH